MGLFRRRNKPAQQPVHQDDDENVEAPPVYEQPQQSLVSIIAPKLELGFTSLQQAESIISLDDDIFKAEQIQSYGRIANISETILEQKADLKPQVHNNTNHTSTLPSQNKIDVQKQSLIDYYGSDYMYMLALKEGSSTNEPSEVTVSNTEEPGINLQSIRNRTDISRLELPAYTLHNQVLCNKNTSTPTRPYHVDTGCKQAIVDSQSCGTYSSKDNSICSSDNDKVFELDKTVKINHTTVSDQEQIDDTIRNIQKRASNIHRVREASACGKMVALPKPIDNRNTITSNNGNIDNDSDEDSKPLAMLKTNSINSDTNRQSIFGQGKEAQLKQQQARGQKTAAQNMAAFYNQQNTILPHTAQVMPNAIQPPVSYAPLPNSSIHNESRPPPFSKYIQQPMNPISVNTATNKPMFPHPHSYQQQQQQQQQYQQQVQYPRCIGQLEIQNPMQNIAQNQTYYQQPHVPIQIQTNHCLPPVIRTGDVNSIPHPAHGQIAQNTQQAISIQRNMNNYSSPVASAKPMSLMNYIPVNNLTNGTLAKNPLMRDVNKVKQFSAKDYNTRPTLLAEADTRVAAKKNMPGLGGSSNHSVQPDAVQAYQLMDAQMRMQNQYGMFSVPSQYYDSELMCQSMASYGGLMKSHMVPAQMHSSSSSLYQSGFPLRSNRSMHYERERKPNYPGRYDRHGEYYGDAPQSRKFYRQSKNFPSRSKIFGRRHRKNDDDYYDHYEYDEYSDGYTDGYYDDWGYDDDYDDEYYDEDDDEYRYYHYNDSRSHRGQRDRMHRENIPRLRKPRGRSPAHHSANTCNRASPRRSGTSSSDGYSNSSKHRHTDPSRLNDPRDHMEKIQENVSNFPDYRKNNTPRSNIGRVLANIVKGSVRNNNNNNSKASDKLTETDGNSGDAKDESNESTSLKSSSFETKELHRKNNSTGSKYKVPSDSTILKRRSTKLRTNCASVLLTNSIDGIAV